MTDPRRLLESGTEFERELLESAALDAPSAGRRRKLVAAAAVTTTSLATATASGAGIAAWKIVVGLVAMGSLAVAVTREPKETVANVDPPPSAIAKTPVTLPSIAPSVLAPPVVVAAPSASSSSVPTPSPAPAAPTASGPSLADEIVWIDAARKAVKSHDGPAALRALDGWVRECKGGTLGLEAAVLRIEATDLAGDHARAQALARAFLEAHPSSNYESRVRKVLP